MLKLLEAATPDLVSAAAISRRSATVSTKARRFQHTGTEVAQRVLAGQGRDPMSASS